MIPSSSCPPSRQLDQSGLTGHHDGRAAVTPLTGTRSTLAKARAVVEAAERDPERWRGALEQMDSSGNVEAAYGKVLYDTATDLLSQPSIFATTMIAGRRLGEFNAREIRWLAAFFGEIGKHLARGAPKRARRVSELFTPAQVRRAIARADRLSQ